MSEIRIPFVLGRHIESVGPHPSPAVGGTQWLYRFDNGYGASIVDSPMVTNGADYELAVIRWKGGDFHLDTSTRVTSDVERGNADEMGSYLRAIQALPEWGGSMSETITLSEAQSELWESDSPSGEKFRRAVRTAPRHERHVEVYSHDGVLLDAWDHQQTEGER